MPLFLAALIGALVSAAGTIVGQVLISLGIGYVTYTGMDYTLNFAKDFVISKISASGAQTVAAASTLKIGVCISIWTSALLARAALNGLRGGSIKKMIVK